MADRSVALSRAYGAHGMSFSSIVLRAPKWKDFVSIGDPVERQPLPGGDGDMVVKHLDRIEAYVERLVQPPVDAAMISDLDLVDALALEDAVLDFFGEARKSRASSTT